VPAYLVHATEYKSLIDKGEPHLLLDVCPAHYFQIVSLSGSLNMPLSVLESKLPMLETSLNGTTYSFEAFDKQCCLYIVCLRGNDSQGAIDLLREKGLSPATLQDLIISFPLHLQKHGAMFHMKKKSHASPV
jgi:adenylyltransferase/sulfurtransferase